MFQTIKTQTTNEPDTVRFTSDESSFGGPIDFFFGGSEDVVSNIVTGYVAQYRKAYPERSVFYFEHHQKDKAVARAQALPNDQALNLIGHSWGGYTARLVAAELDRAISALIFVDPINKMSARYLKHATGSEALSQVEKLVHVAATGKGGGIRNGNLIAGIGRLLGGRWRNLSNEYAAAFNIEAPFPHAYFASLMSYSPAAGNMGSAYEILTRDGN